MGPYNKYVLLRVLAWHIWCEHGARRVGGERCSVSLCASRAKTRPPPRRTIGWWRRPSKASDGRAGDARLRVTPVDAEPLQRVFYELYRDRAAFEAHEEQDTRAFLDGVTQYLASNRGRLADAPDRQGNRRVTTDYQKALGRKIAAERRRRGLSQPELARLIDRSVAWVSQVERGVRKVDRMSVLEALAAALDVPLAELAAEAPVVAAVTDEPPARPACGWSCPARMPCAPCSTGRCTPDVARFATKLARRGSSRTPGAIPS